MTETCERDDFSTEQSHGLTAAKASLLPISVAAQRLKSLLEVADMLTEKPELTEMDAVALDVILESARNHTNEIIFWIGKLSGETQDALPHR